MKKKEKREEQLRKLRDMVHNHKCAYVEGESLGGISTERIMAYAQQIINSTERETAKEIISMTEMTDEEMERIEEKYGFRLTQQP